MKFMTWNVNGIRALTQYHPYCDDLHKNYKEILDYLDADVICLQETKITRAKLESDIALVPGYDSYWSFHRTKSGYSGVVIYVKDHIKLLAVEEGISGVFSENVSLQPPNAMVPLNTQTCSNSSKAKGVGGYPSLDDGDSAAIFARYQELDSEGRGLIIDFGLFVLFNLYCPNETDETRLPFKMDYYHLLESRVQALIKEGRQVIVMGDMNVVPTELDHCDPAKWKKETGESDFTNTLPRRWFNSFLAPAGPMTDLYRIFHKDKPGAFTCWNAKINARPSNYGTRLDYVLVTKGLLPWFKACDRLPHIVGSDHCPVVAEMFTELVIENSTQEKEQDQKAFQKLHELLESYGGTTEHSLAAKYYEEFSGKQQKLSAFFKKPSSATLKPITGSELKRSSPLDDHEDQLPRKKSYFSNDQVVNDDPSPKTDTRLSASNVSSLLPLSNSVPSTTLPSQIPKINNKITTKAKSGHLIQDKSSFKKPVNPRSSGQQSVLSFFSKAEQEYINESQLSNTSSSPPHSQTPDSSFSSATSAPSSLSSTFSPSDFADWIPGSQDILPFSTNGEATTSKWQSLFQPKTIPKCRVHGVPCTEHTVNKKGPNKGRRFFLCSLPVGPEDDTIRPRPEYRCNFFEWRKSERKK
ncbi:Endonuclease/exonuclease/phosphatase [Lobosporangium transversale]|uniref:DNA-(apurinic or apyrimidinic site) endonuclease n=1 Tax=Lobosporangium transversale TaxID=64571 RepID=A0A1Y2GC85_9FUNG|nr:Endonuclease/exonuclease/phosphatase [Lobosporangium transversale]ORZ06815.1 Endonuclease/exonuclease/phosphatase [Lobosporangium transversale]|eukprot:XP_021877736.1 Endonuclease/exonuclease/phosphatase [Lobosporangium transversale]